MSVKKKKKKKTKKTVLRLICEIFNKNVHKMCFDFMYRMDKCFKMWAAILVGMFSSKNTVTCGIM